MYWAIILESLAKTGEVTMENKSGEQIGQKLFGKGCLAFTFLLFCIFSPKLTAQVVVVQLLNGKTGKPISNNRMIVLFPSETSRQSLDLTTNRDGEIRFESFGERMFRVTPMFQVACGEQVLGGPQAAYSVDEILKNGMVTKNTCGHLNVETIRGRLLYFVRPIHWWELFKQ